MKIDYCLHSHTKRCGHALGEDEDYVKAAIDADIKVLGFSDHAMIKGLTQNGIRGDYSLLPDYVNSVKELKEKYKDQIDIKLGFECEYASHLKPYYKEIKEKYGFDYFICGQHFFINKDLSLVHISNDLDEYVKQVCAAIRSKLFIYIAHPDLYVNSVDSWDERCEKYAEKICKTALKYDVALEINVHGRYFKWPKLVYACEDFWRVAGKYQVKVAIGYDIHNPFNEYSNSLDFIDEWKGKYNLNIVEVNELLAKTDNFN